MSTLCAKCNKIVFSRDDEALRTVPKVWHRSCLYCYTCKWKLTWNTVMFYDGELSCRSCIFEKTIEEDSKDVREMVLCAKHGQWEKVFETLKWKPKLINCIPEERSWSVLHQAVWWNDETTVKKLVDFEGCNKQIKTKADRAGHGAGLTPIDVAKKLSEGDRKNRQAIISMIEKKIKQTKPKYYDKDAEPTFLHQDIGVILDTEGPPLLNYTLVKYKKIFYPRRIDKPFRLAMEDVMKYVEEGDNWKSVLEVITLTVSSLNEDADKHMQETNDMIRLNKEQPQRDLFFSRMIELYSTNSVYGKLNESLRRQCFNTREWAPTEEEENLGPYALMLYVLMFHWKKLKSVNTTTYRGMNLGDGLDKYTEGKVFVWLSYVSSSMDSKKAFERDTKFIIDNGSTKWPNSPWSAKDISALSKYSTEKEALYPTNCQFKVTSVDKSTWPRVVHLEFQIPRATWN